jgi:tRNA-Thr(GGU) m(6)t(6)A37 methyltransferase TsaA
LETSTRLDFIAYLRTPFREKFGIPRQAGLVEVPGSIEMVPPWDRRDYFQGLEEVSHLWVTFLFHQNRNQGWRGRVRPPRLGGNQRFGVFATRSPFRPNHLGLSVVRLVEIESSGGRRVRLHVSGVDMVDGTPVLDIKPYIPYADAVRGAHGGFAAKAPEPRLQVLFAETVEQQLAALENGQALREQIRALVALDPRPAYAAGADRGRAYGMRFQCWNIRWRVDDAAATARIVEIRPVQ